MEKRKKQWRRHQVKGESEEEMKKNE